MWERESHAHGLEGQWEIYFLILAQAAQTGWTWTDWRKFAKDSSG